MRLALIIGFSVATARAASSQVAPPPGWKWATDHPAAMTNLWNMPDSSWQFVQMAPGWHITTRPAASMYDPNLRADGLFALETVQILFPGTSQSGYGLFVGGKGLDASGANEMIAFLIRRDGHAMVERRVGSEAAVLLPWTPNPAIQQVTGDNTARNVLKISAGRDSVTFEVNAVRVGALARAGISVDGHFGFRTGADLNLHITTLDYTRRLAPVPAPKP